MFHCRRNQNFLDILKGLNLGQKGVFGITHQFHHVFWFGDLNYRIDMDVQVRERSFCLSLLPRGYFSYFKQCKKEK